MLLIDGFEAAFIGTTYNNSERVAVYSFDKCIKVLIEQGLCYDSAIEHYYHNIEGAYVGPLTPLFVDEMSFEMLQEIEKHT